MPVVPSPRSQLRSWPCSSRSQRPSWPSPAKAQVHCPSEPTAAAGGPNGTDVELGRRDGHPTLRRRVFSVPPGGTDGHAATAISGLAAVASNGAKSTEVAHASHRRDGAVKASSTASGASHHGQLMETDDEVRGADEVFMARR